MMVVLSFDLQVTIGSSIPKETRLKEAWRELTVLPPD
jgi:hypothetical protein